MLDVFLVSLLSFSSVLGSSIKNIGNKVNNNATPTPTYINTSLFQITAIKYANTPKVPETVCIHVNALPLSFLFVQSAINERVGLKLTLIDKSSVNATDTAIANKPSVPFKLKIF